MPRTPPPDELVQRVVGVASEAAGFAAASLLRADRTVGWTTLEDKETGAISGIVIVCFDEAVAKRLLHGVGLLPDPAGLGRVV